VSPAGATSRLPTARLVGRGLTRRCPRCGAGHLFSHWFNLVERCPRCGYLFAREEGFFLGAIVINFAVTEISLGIVLAVLIALEAGGGAPLGAFIVAAVAVTILVPLVFYPFSKTVWSAIDLIMHPHLQVYDLDAPPRPRRGTDLTQRPAVNGDLPAQEVDPVPGETEQLGER
jgi:uncharacterized protein (DUF983 family)